MSTKTVKTASPSDRERLLVEFIHIAIRRAEMCRLSGSPDDVLLIARSVIPLIIHRLHSRHIGPCRSLSPAAILENLKCNNVIDETRHAEWLSGSSAASEFGTSRSCTPLVKLMKEMQEVLANDLRKRGFYAPAKVKRSNAKPERPQRPALLRWASAAVGLFAIGSQS